MQIQPKPASIKNPPEQYTGDIWLDPIAGPKDPGQRMVVGRVRFAPGARTAWHTHELGQTLHITQGVALIGSRDSGVIEATPGQTIYIAPGEVHWHGATPEDYMEHLAMLDRGEDPATTTVWFEHVTDEDYRRP